MLPATVQSNAAVESVSPPVGLTFEQQKELLLLTLNAEMEKEHLKYSLEKDKLNVEMEKEHLKQSLEKEKLGLQQYRLDLIKAGMIVGNAEGSGSSEEPATAQVKGFDVVRNLRLIPKFDEKDPDTFFILFERVADMRGWPETDRFVKLQSVFTGEAQEAYSALSAVDYHLTRCSSPEQAGLRSL